jgi:hypothetical protein
MSSRSVCFTKGAEKLIVRIEDRRTVNFMRKILKAQKIGLITTCLPIIWLRLPQQSGMCPPKASLWPLDSTALAPIFGKKY